MKKMLKREKNRLFYYENGIRIEGMSCELCGDSSWLRGNCSDLWGNCSDLWGDCTGLSGDCSGLSGNCTGLRGNIDNCGITPEERKSGVNIVLLVEEVKEWAE